MSAINDLINAYIQRNANQEITGPVLNGVLNAMANALNTPYIGPNGDWYVYDPALGQFVDSGNSSTLFNQVVVDVLNTYGTPGCNVYISGGTLYMEFENLKGDPGPEGPEGPTGPAGPAGVTSATASVDANTGTPYVDVNVVSQVLQLAFHNLKGAQGNPGTPGAAAGFGTPTASVDANTGTPSVAVTASGPDTAKVFNFAFHNLKGATGATGATGPAAGFGTPTASADANVGTPSVVVTASGPDTAKVFDFAFHNIKGSDAQVTSANIAAALGYTPADAASVPTTYAGSASAGGPADKALAIPYGAVDAGSTATDIKATVDNFPATLVDGVCAYIRNDVVASASGFTLDINGTGALPVYSTLNDATRATTVFTASSTYLFIYNSTRVAGGCWDIYYGYNSDTNTIAYNVRQNGALPPTASKFYRYRILFASPDGRSLIPSNTSSSTNATAARTVNQAPINPFGPILYYSTTTAVEANTSPGASYMWQQYSGITFGYSFNRTGAALTMTPKEPIYLKCAPQADGSAIMDSADPFVQALPSTDDGKIYIFLGYAESATAMTLYRPGQTTMPS